MSATRLAARIAVREARRRPFRSLLVVALVAIPVMGMTVATTLIRTDDRTPIEEWDARWGTTDVVAHTGPAPEEAADIAVFERRLAPGTRTTRMVTGHAAIRDDRNRSFATFVSADVTDPLLAGRFSLLDGRLPTGGAEVAVNRAMADRFDLRPGAPFVLVRPAPISLDVVGIVQDAECVRCELVLGSGAIPDAAGPYVEHLVLVDLPGTPDVEVLRSFQDGSATAAGGTSIGWFETRPLAGLEMHDSTSAAAIRWSMVIGALALAVVGIVIAAAFAVGARRQLVLLGQLGANGAPESLLRRVLALQGTVTGMLGSLLGTTLGLVGLRAGQPTVERFLDRHLTGFEPGGTELAVIALIGIAGATFAALVPARSAARISTLHALAGRRPIERVRSTLTASGLVAMLGGLGLLAVATVGATSGTSGSMWAAVAIAGGLCVLFGATSLTPAMVQRLEPLAGRTHGTLRVAARSLARNRTRTGAVVAAVAAAGALAVGGTAAARAVTTEIDHTRLAPSTAVVSRTLPTSDGEPVAARVPADVEAQLAAALPDATIHHPATIDARYTISYPESPDQPAYGSNSILVLDDALAEDMRLSQSARTALRDEGVVVVDFDDGSDQVVQLVFDSGESVTAPLRFSRYSLGGFAAGVYVTPAFAEGLPGRTVPGPVVATNPGRFSVVELFDLQELWSLSPVGSAGGADTSAFPGVDPTVDIQFGFERDGLDQRGLELLLAAVSVLFALVVVGIGLALAAADEKDEREILTVTGAGPGMLSRVAGAKAWLLATLGFALAVPVGFLPAATVVTTSDMGRVLHFPASLVVALLLVAPLAAAAAAYTVSSITRRVRPVRVSTATFD